MFFFYSFSLETSEPHPGLWKPQSVILKKQGGKWTDQLIIRIYGDSIRICGDNIQVCGALSVEWGRRLLIN